MAENAQTPCCYLRRNETKAPFQVKPMHQTSDFRHANIATFEIVSA